MIKAIRSTMIGIASLVLLVGCTNNSMPSSNTGPLAGGTCPQGTWLASADSLTNYMRGVIITMQPTVTSGSMQMSFNNGRFTQETGSMVVKSNIGDQTMEMKMVGGTNGTYSEVAPGQLQLTSDGTGTTRVESVTINGQPFTNAPIDMSGMFIGQQSALTYQCAGNTLTLNFNVADRQAAMVLTRM
ncbi:MAG: hypothetical protein HY817_04520 [Candidatus Abawacabacteria bacterium]|nr:hypothetical protein [Candidatus Abawacabacteria bacterium]